MNRSQRQIKPDVKGASVRAGLTGLLACGLLELAGATDAHAQTWPSLGRKKAEPKATAAAVNQVAGQAVAEPQVRLNYTAQTWDAVLQKFAADCGATLVMEQVPRGRFTRNDLQKYSRSEAVRILNQQLAEQDFRVLVQGNFLVVVHLPAVRPEYRRAEVPAREDDVTSATSQRPQVQKSQVEQAAAKSRPVPATRPMAQSQAHPLQQAFEQRPMQGPRRDSLLKQAAFQADDAANADQLAAGEIVTRSFKPQRKTARALSSNLLDTFRDRTDVIENGPEGLPALRVYASSKAKPDAPRPVLFTLGIDVGGNELLVVAPEQQAELIVRLLNRMDGSGDAADQATRVVATKKGPTAVAKNVQAAVAKLVAQQQVTPGDDGKTETNRKDENGKPLPDVVGGVRGDVNVEAMEDLGILIIKGNQADVDAVMAVINQIEQLSAESSPDVTVRLLKNIDSTALAELLTEVYDKLKDAQGKKTDSPGGVSVIAVVRPNAVLVLAAKRELDSVMNLISELDKPLAAKTAFAVFPLEHAIAAQVETMLTDFYDKRGGLGTRIRIIADSRTNQVVVLAQPNDLREIAALIPQLDKGESGAVSQVKVYALKHSVADNLAQTLNLIFQSVLNPAQLGQGQLGQQVLGIGGGNSSQQLREVKSAVLEYLGGDGAQQKYRSGILADIRITADDRSNTLIVTAPAESVELVASLIDRLDRPAENVAEIKHFSLRNADAAAVTQLLNQLFNNTTQTNQGGGGQGGLNNNQSNQQPGIQLAGAPNSPSTIPLRFSVDTRTNSIMALGTAETLDIVDALIVRLDSDDARARKTRVIALKNGPERVSDPNLRQNTTTQTGQTGIISGTQETLVNNHPIVDAINAFLQREMEVTQQTQQGATGNAGVSVLSFNDRVERQPIIQWEPITNSVLVSAAPQRFDQIIKMIETLDMQLPQVVIQALLVEVTLNNTDEFGVELGIQDSLLFSRGLSPAAGMASTGAIGPGFNFNDTTPSGSTLGLPNASTTGRNDLAGQGLSNFALGRRNADLGYGGLVLSAGSESINVLLRALSENRRVEVLSRPQIRTLHNRLGSISIATDVPRPTTSNLTATGLAQQSIEYTPAGITLDVLPKITSDGQIQLQVKATKRSLLPNAITVNGQAFPTIDGTTAASTITISDAQTAVIGGLISRDDRETTRKVPWLGDLPVIGKAFRFDSTSHQRKELIIFLTPRVIRTDEDSEQIKAIEAARLHWTECNAEEIHGPIFGIPPEHVAPVVDPHRFDSLIPQVPPDPGAPVPQVVPPAVPGSPMSRRTVKDSGVRPASHEAPARTSTRQR